MAAEDTIEQESDRARYGDILRSTSLIGASSVISMVLSVVRLKILAVLLGPAGVGLFGLFNVIVDLTSSLAGMGVQASGVRQVAVATATGELQKVARIARVLMLMSLVLGTIGALLLVIFAAPVSKLTFESEAQTSGIMLLGMAVFFRVVAGGPTAIIQGNRRIGDLARVTIVGAVLNTVTAIPLVYWLGEAGIVPSMLAVGLTSLIAALWYRRNIRLPAIRLSWREFSSETRMLVTLGFAFMVSGLLTAGAALVIRIFIVQQSGVDAAGNYQAAWALGGIYVGFILQSMGTDFYPRLSAMSTDDRACNRMVNEQARVSMLLAAPGLLGTLALAPLVIAVFYSAKFVDAVPLLRWFCVGMLLRVVAWPMGFVILAKGAQQMFFWTEVVATIVHVGLAWLLLAVIGLEGAGLAFVGLYAWHSVLIYYLVRRLSGFRWATENLALGAIFACLTGFAVLAVEVLPLWPGAAVALVCTAVACWFSLTQLIRLVPENWVPLPLRPVVYFVLLHQPQRSAPRS